MAVTLGRKSNERFRLSFYINLNNYSTMKILRFAFVFFILAASVVGCKYDDEELWNRVNSLEERIESLESQLTNMNKDISSISTVVNALQNNLSVTSIEETENGYTLTFSDDQKITIKNGTDGEDGNDAPIIGVDLFEGKYYWTQTIDGTKTWLTDAKGNKFPVAGESGVTPRLKVSATGHWMVSYDNGISYTEVLDEKGKPVQAVGKDGEDGEDGKDGHNGSSGSDGKDGDSFFKDVKVDGDELVLVLKDGMEIKIPFTGEVESNSPFTFILNIDDPEILMAEADEETVIHLYGEKNSEGLAESISTIVIKNQTDGNTTIRIDENRRPTYIEAANGVIYELIWDTETTGVLNAFDPSSNVRVNIAFDTEQENGVAESQSIMKATTKRSGVVKYQIRPLKESDLYKKDLITKTAEYNDQQCLVTFQKCDDYYDPISVYLAVSSQKTGVLLSELREYSKEGIGKYLFPIPSETYPSRDWETIANAANEVLKGIGNISLILKASGGDYILCSAVAVGLAAVTGGIGAAAIPTFTVACTTTIKAMAYLHIFNTVGYPDVEGAPALSDLLLQSLIDNKVIKREYTDNLILTPIVNGTLSGGNGAEGIITPNDNSVIIPVITEGTPLINRFYLDPANPVEAQSYIAHAFLQCMPVGSTVTMHIEGDDGYINTEVSTLETSNAEITLWVPGAAKGVFDVVTVTVNTPDGETYQSIASLYFH